MSDLIVGVADRLEAKAGWFVKDKRLPGAAVGVVHGDRLVWSAGIGFADIPGRRVADALSSVLNRSVIERGHRRVSAAAHGCTVIIPRPVRV